jgi:hypothetical protein
MEHVPQPHPAPGGLVRQPLAGEILPLALLPPQCCSSLSPMPLRTGAAPAKVGLCDNRRPERNGGGRTARAACLTRWSRTRARPPAPVVSAGRAAGVLIRLGKQPGRNGGAALPAPCALERAAPRPGTLLATTGSPPGARAVPIPPSRPVLSRARSGGEQQVPPASRPACSIPACRHPAACRAPAAPRALLPAAIILGERQVATSRNAASLPYHWLTKPWPSPVPSGTLPGPLACHQTARTVKRPGGTAGPGRYALLTGSRALDPAGRPPFHLAATPARR